MKNTIFKILVIANIFCFSSAYSQGFIVKETKFHEPYSNIVKGYFKNGHNVILRSKNSSNDFYVMEINPMTNSQGGILDSFYSTNSGFEFFEQSSSFFYEYIKTDYQNSQVYLYRKNLSSNQKDSILISQYGSQGYSGYLKRYGDTDIVNILSYNDALKKFVNSYYIISGNAVVKVVTKVEYAFSSISGADFCFFNKQLIITVKENNNYKIYTHSISNSKIDSATYYYFMDNSNPLQNLNLTMVNGKFVMLANYQNKDSLFVFDLGLNGSIFNLRNKLKINGVYTFIGLSDGVDYFITGNYSGVNNSVCYLDNTYNIAVKSKLSKTLNKQDTLGHSYFFTNNDTMYFMGNYLRNPDKAILTKVYPAKTGFGNKNENSNIKVYPNPSKGDFIISNATSAEIKFVVFDVLGHAIFAENVGAQGEKLIAIDLPPAIYFIKVENGFCYKLIVE